MSLQAPKLDDRTFYDLLEEAKRIVRERCPAWTDLSAGDPGTTLLELYAFLTEVMLYRINRLPEKAYIEFLRMMGVKLAPSSAARVALRLHRNEGFTRRIEVPRGTRVTVARSAEGEDAPVFVTAAAVTLEPDRHSATVLAHHCRLIQGEGVGVSSGLAGQSFELRNAPVVAPTGDELDLVIAVETTETLDERVASLNHGGATFRVWREVEHFARLDGDEHVYVADRATGTITFAPAVRAGGAETGNGLAKIAEALAAVPPAGMRICAWYRCGGGPAGNVAARVLTVLKDPIPGLRVDNPGPAVGGCEVESLDNALLRGPQELHSLHRAVTARDYEAVALREGSVGRAHAVARADRWRFAAPGTVQLLLVPELARTEQNLYSKEQLESAQTEEALARVRQAIDERRPLGTGFMVDWYRYKPVRVHARLVLHPEEDLQAVRGRVVARLCELINPLGNHPLRRRLHASDIYHTVLNEPGVLYADGVKFSIDQAPDADVMAVTNDPFHPGLWYAAAGCRLFRTMDDGMGWELLQKFDGEEIEKVVCCDGKAGLVAAVSVLSGEEDVSRIRLSRDCGRSWTAMHELGFRVNDAAWLDRGGAAILLLATDEGLFQLPPESGPVPVLVEPKNQSLGFYAVVAVDAPRIGTQVAVAARNSEGIYLCPDEQLEGFRNIGLKGQDVRVLSAQCVGPRAFLWAGLAAVGGAEGDGCLRWELRRDPGEIEGWRSMGSGWRGGSCRAIASYGEHVYAATFHAGVLSMDSAEKDPVWQVPGIDCGLPLRDTERLLHRVHDLAVASPLPEADTPATILCGGPGGVFRSEDGSNFRLVSATIFTEHVTIGEGYLFCSDTHAIETVHDATT
ncbi:phage baseplate protein J, putative [Syntrophotalea carbinolica DSM 2380]|uniref:Phage baseplate protein J, putative n=1 Tax=Syntrophotalea carbinolica (strain DSM 2380 / NBRC 103641 / GraBd1) TaxID=338963 RepID=Q3A0I3_SYNC1|nr:baseplate J/gp47 family protein [Syntrophotalea carbinolica]ABA90124.1 phage baseplate protein J, putative [Syntrophotalea carbinolica DSM 2380]